MRSRKVLMLLVGIVMLQWLLIALLLPGIAGAAPTAQGDVELALTIARQAQTAASLATIVAIISLVISLASLIALAAVSFNPPGRVTQG
jgi:hypothetical protein